ncbi:MAG: EamA family transporter [Rhodobacteraceae bacterium]|nr:EamA family transporter [Paracoccaceae bacterium]MAY45711.1 EamA family transporter [Paracoccaceae bacterium]QEW20600.1 carboxylate/amino acid/amine transporter [Marinibacterium anthonyi]
MTQAQDRPGRAAVWMIGAIASFSAMAVAGREVSAQLDTFELMTYRSLVGVIIVSAVLTLTRSWHKVTTDRLGLHLIRNVMHFSGQNLWFFAVTMIPLAQVFALEFTQPIWVLLLSPLLLGERLTPVRGLAAAMGFAGILIVIRPGADSMNVGVLAAAIAAIFFAFTTIFTKRLTRTASIGCILFWLTAIQLGLGLITAGHDFDITLPDAQTAPWVVLVALGGLLAHYCVANALAIAPATFVIPIDFARVPTIAIVGMILYGEPLDIWVFVGAIVIFAGNYINLLAEKKARAAPVA